MEKRGIDISYHQGNIDFNTLKGNVDFAMVRTSYGHFTEDNKYKEYVQGLEGAGIPYGFYHFSYATTVSEAIEEAEGFINIIKNYKPLYPVAFDVESSNVTEDVRADDLVDIVDAFCSRVEKAGYYVVIYANLSYLNGKLNSSKLDKYDKWLAQWASKPTYTKPFGMWQYSSKGSMPGISGNVDLDIAYKDYPTIIQEKGLNNYNGSQAEPGGEQEPGNVVNYVVKKGDTLSGIASKYSTTYQKLASYNGISNPDKIYPGQIIKIPEQVEISPSTYVVKKGDTLSGIASKHGTTWQKLYEKNKSVIGNNPDKIYPGQILSI